MDESDRPRRRPPGQPPAAGAADRKPSWRRPPAEQTWPVSSCGCRECRAACENSPGWFLPEEVERLADYLNLTLAALFREQLAVGVTHMPDGGLRHGVMPHKYRDHKKPGSLWTLAELAQPGRCVFYDHGRCAIYPVRPFECARMIHGQPKQAAPLRHHIVQRWTAAALRPFEALVGQRLAPREQRRAPQGGEAPNAGADGRERPRRPPSGNRRAEADARERSRRQPRRPDGQPQRTPQSESPVHPARRVGAPRSQQGPRHGGQAGRPGAPRQLRPRKRPRGRQEP